MPEPRRSRRTSLADARSVRARPPGFGGAATGSSGGAERSCARASCWPAAAGAGRATPPSRRRRGRSGRRRRLAGRCARRAIDLLVAPADRRRPAPRPRRACASSLRVPYRAGRGRSPSASTAGARSTQAAFAVWGVMPTPVGEPYGLDTLRFFALCRLALPRVAHLLADVGALGPRLAQMASASAPTSCSRRSSPSARCAWAPTPTTRP